MPVAFVAAELGLPELEAHKFLGEVGVSVRPLAGVDSVLLWDLEQAVFRWFVPGASDEQVRASGNYYRGLRQAAILTLLKERSGDLTKRLKKHRGLPLGLADALGRLVSEIQANTVQSKE